jgi:outer membrane cobalamin receptor
LTVTVYLALLGGIYAKDINNNTVKLNTGADLGGNAEYQIVPRLSAFVQLNNILDDKYQRWYGYQSYGLNIYGGVRLKF